MRGRLIFWLLAILAICLLVAEVECKKGKKGKKSKEKHSHSHSKKSSRKSSENSDSKEWGWNNQPQTDNRRPGRPNPQSGGQTIYRNPNNRNNGRHWGWQWQGRGGRRTTPTTTTTTTPAPWWRNGHNWQGPGQGGWDNQWWTVGNGGQSNWWEDPGYWENQVKPERWWPNTEDWNGSSDDSSDWDDWNDWNDWDDWDDSKGSKKHSHGSKKHSHGSKKHSHGSKEHSHGSKKHSHGSKKHSHGSKEHSHGHSGSSQMSSGESSESGEWIEIVIIGAGNHTGIDMDWCRNWCHRFVRQNFYTLFPTRRSWPYRSQWRPTNYNIRRRCNDFIEQYGYYCNVTGGVGPTTTAATTTDSMGRDFSCRSADDCYYDECCVAYGNIYNKTCMKLSGYNDECSRAEEIYNSNSGVYWESCPCTYGYECISKWDFIIRKSPASLRGLLRNQQQLLGEEKKCKHSHNVTVVTTTERPVVTMLPPMERTTPSGYTRVWNNTEGQVTLPPMRSCRSHLDCDFFQCCVHDDDDTPEVGECINFSERDDFCTSLSDLATTSKLDHCPCQSFLQCKGYTRGALSDLVYYKCG